MTHDVENRVCLRCGADGLGPRTAGDPCNGPGTARNVRKERDVLAPIEQELGRLAEVRAKTDDAETLASIDQEAARLAGLRR